MSTLNAGETLQPFKPLRNNLIFDSSGNLVGIQNDRANGTDLRLNGGSAGTFSSLVVQAAGTLDLYNTADQTTNYERLRASWNGNVASLFTVRGGTGSIRTLRLGVASAADSAAPDLGSLRIETTVNSPFSFTCGSSAGTSSVGIDLLNQTLVAASGTQTAARIASTINQSGTAGYIALDINPTETATGSGTKLLQRWAVGGTTYAQLSNNGFLGANAGVVTGSSGTLGFSATLNSSGTDAGISRDAADTLALRRSTNAQTFRVYNTYTDASNYERCAIYWSTGAFYIGTEQAGTGSARQLNFLVGGVTRWAMNTSGHFLAEADNTYDIGASGANRPRNIYLGSGIVAGGVISTTNYISSLYSIITDGATAPGATVGVAKIYVDSADGDLKIIFGDGTIKTIVTDT